MVSPDLWTTKRRDRVHPDGCLVICSKTGGLLAAVETLCNPRGADQFLGPTTLWSLDQVFLPVEMEMRTEVEIVV